MSGTGSSYLDGLFYRAIAWAGTVLTQRPIANFKGGLKAVDNPATNSTDVDVDPSAINASAAGASFELGTPTGSPALSQGLACSAGTVGSFFKVQCYDAGGGQRAARVTSVVENLQLTCSGGTSDDTIALGSGISLQSSTGYVEVEIGSTKVLKIDGTGWAFGTTPAATQTYTNSYATTSRSLLADGSNATAVLSNLINDLKAKKIIL